MLQGKVWFDNNYCLQCGHPQERFSESAVKCALPKRDMAVSIASSGLICFTVTEISLKPAPYYDLWDYAGSQRLQQLQASSNTKLHLHLLNSLHQNGADGLHKISSQLFLGNWDRIPEEANAVWFSGGNREFCRKYRREKWGNTIHVNVELKLGINKQCGKITMNWAHTL